MDYIKQNFGDICLCFSSRAEKRLDSLKPFDIIQFVDEKKDKGVFSKQRRDTFYF